MDLKQFTEYIEQNRKYLKVNSELFEIFEGNLRPYVDDILRQSLSDQYYSRIQERIYPINILKRVIDKMSKVYGRKPLRYATTNKDILELYERLFNINYNFNKADEFNNLFKGYAMEPFINNEGVQDLRVLPFDRFLVESQSIQDPAAMTRFYKYIGKTEKGGKEIDVWLVYQDDLFVAIDADGDIVDQFMQDEDGERLDGTNPIGFIPFFYSGESDYKVMPTQDTDTLALTKLLPVQISDLSGSILFQCFSIIVGIDVDDQNLIMSPNAFWNFKSDPQSDKQPSVDVLSPKADIEKVLQFIKETFSMWLETRGIRVGSLGHTDGKFNASGISKIIDEMDTSEMVKKGQEKFKRDERKFWRFVAKMHNYWLDSGQISGLPRLPEDWEVIVEFDEPKPLMNRSEMIDNILKEKDGGIISLKTAIKQLYPDWEEKDIAEEMKQIEDEELGVNNGETTTSEDQA